MGVDGQRELEDFLNDSGALAIEDDKPRSVGEALEAGEQPEEAEEQEVVHDAPKPLGLPGEQQPSAVPVEQKPVEDKPEEEEAEEDGEPHVVWATKKYGKDPLRWAKAAYDQERFISQLAADKKQAEDEARQAYEYAQSVEATAQAGPSAMPMSAVEEAWVEPWVAKPLGYDYKGR